jgi:hypothetical protein
VSIGNGHSYLPGVVLLLFYFRAPPEGTAGGFQSSRFLFGKGGVERLGANTGRDLGPDGRLPGMMHKQSTHPIIPRVWSDDVREHAYQLYSGPAKQNLSATARLLTDAIAETVSYSTVQGWSVSGRWADRYAGESVVQTTETMDRYVGLLWVAVIPALRTISAVSDGTLSVADNTDRLRAAQFIVDKAQQLLLAQAKAKPNATEAASGVKLARIPESVDLSALNSTELEQLESQLREQAGTDATRTG